jgi:hypothetical protein
VDQPRHRQFASVSRAAVQLFGCVGSRTDDEPRERLTWFGDLAGQKPKNIYGFFRDHGNDYWVITVLDDCNG